MKPFKLDVVLGRITVAMSRVRLRSWVSAKIAADAENDWSHGPVRELAVGAALPPPPGAFEPYVSCSPPGSGASVPRSVIRPGTMEARVAELEDVRLALMEAVEDMQARVLVADVNAWAASLVLLVTGDHCINECERAGAALYR